MIKNLRIKNYALLKEVNIDFEKGFTVISGETGSGKSIMLDALSLLLGKRVDRISKKSNKKTVIEAVFCINKSKKKFFIEHDLDFQKNTIVRREISLEGRSRAFINDTPVLINVLLDFSYNFIEVYAQHQTIFVKENNAQFALLDQLALSNSLLLEYQKEYYKYNQLKLELKAIQSNGVMSDSEIEFLRYQLDEIDRCDIQVGEKHELEKNISILENIEAINEVISYSKENLNNENGIVSQLSNLRRKLSDFDNFNEINDRIDSVVIELNDISSDFNLFSDDVKLNANDLNKFSNRLDIINSLLQKHKVNSLDELFEYKQFIDNKINISKSFEKDIKNMNIKISNQFKIVEDLVTLLNKKRNESIPNVTKMIERCLSQLGMPYARFNILLQKCDSFHQNGNTNVSFCFSANKGGALLELSKVASGGELSRLMLAIKFISSKYSNLDTLIFDEIDSGVSGEIASLMGEMMKKMGESTQVLAISHLPQIASKGERHLKVIKTVVNSETVSDIITLNNNERVKEIAKLLSGEKITEAAFDNARALLHQ